MKRSDLFVLVSVAVVAGVVSLLISGVVFSPKHFSQQVPIVTSIQGTFPDVTNNSAYNSFLNTNGLDLTEPIHIGNAQNQTPFSTTTGQ